MRFDLDGRLGGLDAVLVGLLQGLLEFLQIFNDEICAHDAFLRLDYGSIFISLKNNLKEMENPEKFLVVRDHLAGRVPGAGATG
jgi:hypothetical protein